MLIPLDCAPMVAHEGCKILLFPRSHFKSHRMLTKTPIRCTLLLLVILQTGGCGIEHSTLQQSKEAVLKEELYNLRMAIDQFTEDQGIGPESLDEVVHAGYLHDLPHDPFTKSQSTWRIEFENFRSNRGRTHPVIVDVHSGSDASGSDGTRFDSW